MSYADKLRKGRREELALRVQETWGEVTFATKSEGSDGDFPSSDYAYVPDPDKPSTWKLRLTSTPGGAPDAHIVGAAVAALGKGFRGNKVEIPEADLAAVKIKVKAAWKKANPDKVDEDIPAVIASAEEVVSEDIVSEAPTSQEPVVACGDMMGHHDDEGLGYGPVEGADRAFLEALLPHHTDILTLIAKTDFEDEAIAGYAADIAEKIIKGSAEIRSKLKVLGPDTPEGSPEVAVPEGEVNPVLVEAKKYVYDIEISDFEFAGLPPFMKVGMVKNLKKQLAAEKDPEKKAEIQAKIDKLEEK